MEGDLPQIVGVDRRDDGGSKSILRFAMSGPCLLVALSLGTNRQLHPAAGVQPSWALALV